LAEAQLVLDELLASQDEFGEALAGFLRPLLVAAIIGGNRVAIAVLIDHLDLMAAYLEPMSWECVGRVLGAGAMLLGRQEDARRYYDQALDLATRVGHRPEQALIRLGLAELDVCEGHLAAAHEHLALCLPELERMQMGPALERALGLRKSLDAE